MGTARCFVWRQAALEPQAVALPAQAEIPVNSYTEWDPLEEVIVGRLEGATIPSGHVSRQSESASACREGVSARRRLSLPKMDGARLPSGNSTQFIHILESEGITVRRPDIVDFVRPYRSPHWSSRGFSTACPRDIFTDHRQRNHRDADLLALALFRGRRISFPAQGILLERCTLDRRAKTAAH